MIKFIKYYTYFFLIFILQLNAVAIAAPENSATTLDSSYNIRELALPSEVTGLGKKSGSIFYTPSVKGKVLMPVHFWGEVSNSGIHFIPVDTSLINGISIAGGPRSEGNLDNVKLMRAEKGKIKEFTFDLSSGGDEKAYRQILKPGDTIFIEKSNFFENRSYYTSLVGVFATILSSILIYRQVKN